MGSKFVKSEPEAIQRDVPSLCLRMQGLNEHQQCGRNYFPFKHQKVVISAVGGMSHSLAILKTGEFIAWGSNNYGQLGIEVDSYLQSYLYEKSILSPVAFPKQFNRLVIISVAAGAWHSVCVTDNFEVFAWGLATHGQLGMNPKDYNFLRDFESNERYCPKPILVTSLKDRKSIAASCGGNFTVIRTQDSKVFTFGAGQDGQLGNGTTDSTHIPQEVIALDSIKIKKLTCGFHHCIALTPSGKVYSWGNIFVDILRTAEPILYPQEVEGIEKVKDIACGDYHCCAVLKKHGQLMVWGSNGYGQFGSSLYGLDFYSSNPIPSQVNQVNQVVCGGLYTVAKFKDGSVFAWGCNRQKQIGEGFEGIVREPSLIVRENQIVKKLATGYSHLFLFSTEILSDELIVTPKSYGIKGSLKHEDGSTWRDATSDKA